MARLDRLAPGKEVAQLGAVLGRSFSYDLIRAVSPLDEEALQHGLAQLVDAELLYQRGHPPQAQYLFKHALIQDAAYQSLLRSTRQLYHQRIAQVLEERFPETATTQPELMAHHYTEAGLSAQAVLYWQKAGQRAVERSAHVEATSHLRKGLAVLQMLPSTPGRVQQELVLQTTLGQAFMATKGLASPDVEHVYTRARELSQQIEGTLQLFPILSGLQRFYVVRAELQTARELGQQLLSLAQHRQDPALRLETHRALGNALTWLGEVGAAHQHLEQGIALYDPQQYRSNAFLYGRDPGVDCLSYAAMVLWILGYPARALRRSQDALTLAQTLGHPYSLAQVLLWAAFLHQFRQERALTQERATELIALCTAQEFTQWLAAGTIHRGWALAAQGQGVEGVTQICQGLDAVHATGARVGRPYQLALLAEACWNIGQLDEGLQALAEAFAAVHSSGGYWYEAELNRLKGELLLAQDGTRQTRMEMEACFHQALVVARRQQAKSLELRAAMSLSRLWQRQGKLAAARQLLTDVYGWFTEGFDTADLQEAKALLEELV